MKKLFYGLILSLSILTSCEKEEDLGNFDAINVSSITNSSAYVYGDAKVESKCKGLIISEQPNVSEANGTAYYDEKSVGKRFVFTISRLFANTKYYFKVFYTDPSGGKVFSSEKTFTTTNIVMATIFESLVDKDTVLNGKPISQVGFMLKESGGIRNAEYGICYSKSSAPAVTDTKIAGNIGSNGLILCNTSSMNFYDTVMVRPYCKSDKGIDYGVATKYVRPSWINCGLFPGNTSCNPGSIVYNGKGFIILGLNPNGDSPFYSTRACSDMWSFNPNNFLWTKEVSLLEIIKASDCSYICNMKSVPLSNGFLFYKGEDYSGRVYNRFFTYNTADKQYTQMQTNGIPNNVIKYSWGYDGITLGGQSYVAMYLGYSSIQNESSGAILYKYNESSRIFEQETANVNRLGVSNTACFALGDMVYMGAGSYSVFSTTNTTDFWSYNVKTKIWTPLKDAPISKFKKSFVYKNRCFAIGYNDNKLYEYIVGSDSWGVIEKLPYSVEAVMPFDDGLYIFTSHEVKIDNYYSKYVNRVWRSAAL
jgi:hypothetical protein